MGKIYGIDLGTTYSLIGHSEKLYMKTGTTKPLIHSIANIKTGEAGNSLNENFSEDVRRSFKCNMSMGPEGKISIEASALVLKEVCSYVEDDIVKDVIITVPAYFTDNNRQAVRCAAEKAGLNVVRLINEPTAAAAYYNKGKRALTLAYDLGGGTFDVSLIDNRLGEYEVITTDGRTIGGDNLDTAIRDEVIKNSKLLLHRVHEGDLDLLKELCEKAKISIQHTKKDYTIDLRQFSHTGCSDSYVLTVDEYKRLVKTVFADTIKLTDRIMRKYITPQEEYNFILIGGSTRDPFIAELLYQELGVIPEPLTYNPDELVARGAAYCAELQEKGMLDSTVADIISSPIGIGMINGTVKHVIMKDSRLPITQMKPFVNPEPTKKLQLQIFQGDSNLICNSQLLGELMYDYGEDMPAGKGLVNVKLSVDRDGTISIAARQGRKKEQKLTLNRKLDVSRVCSN